jgi:hypothetical protein
VLDLTRDEIPMSSNGMVDGSSRDDYLNTTYVDYRAMIDNLRDFQQLHSNGGQRSRHTWVDYDMGLEEQILIQDGINRLQLMSRDDILSGVRIRLLGNVAIDSGGVFKDVTLILSDAMKGNINS